MPTAAEGQTLADRIETEMMMAIVNAALSEHGLHEWLILTASTVHRRKYHYSKARVFEAVEEAMERLNPNRETKE